MGVPQQTPWVSIAKKGLMTWMWGTQFFEKKPLYQFYLGKFYHDLTVLPNPGIIVSKGNDPKMAELFRFVKYYNLPIFYGENHDNPEEPNVPNVQTSMLIMLATFCTELY